MFVRDLAMYYRSSRFTWHKSGFLLMLHLDIPRLICIMHFCFVLAIRYKFNLLKSTKNTILDENKCFCGISYVIKGEYIDADLKNVNFK